MCHDYDATTAHSGRKQPDIIAEIFQAKAWFWKYVNIFYWNIVNNYPLNIISMSKKSI